MPYGNHAVRVTDDTKSSILKNPHWAILTFSQTQVEGDERSRTNPGHGYPAHTVNTVEYAAFANEENWKAEVSELENPKYGSKSVYHAMYVIPATVTKTVNVEINIPGK
jgi:hypothetical protein